MSIADLQPFQWLYVSESAPGTSDDVVAGIADASRMRNLAAGISGALLFDGHRFCQLLEGGELEVRLLMTRIRADSRHRILSIAAENHFGLPRLTSHWRFGHCPREVLDPLASSPLPKDEVALALFMSALTRSAAA